jgi:hypothetical protein
MPQLTLVFDPASNTITRASIDGREVGVLMKGMANLTTRDGGNLLAEYEGPTQSLARAQLDIAQAFGFDVEGRQS